MSCLIRQLYTRKIIQILSDTIVRVPIQRTVLLNPAAYSNLQITRYKSKGSKKNIPEKVSETESEDEIKDEDIFDNIKDKHTKTMEVHVTSLRVDTLLKAGLGISRNKLEVTFYESKIRVNGEKIPKKSVNVMAGDEIDVIKSTSSTNPDFLIVARVEILSAKGENDTISVKLRRCKSLTIENYEGKNKWSQSQGSQEPT